MTLSKAGELQRAEKLSIEQRILTALSLRQKLGSLSPVAITKKHD